jgi:hypothetical protein
VLSLYAKGMTTGDISAHFAEIYGASVSKETISRITDKVVAEMRTMPLPPQLTATTHRPKGTFVCFYLPRFAGCECLEKIRTKSIGTAYGRQPLRHHARRRYTWDPPVRLARRPTPGGTSYAPCAPATGTTRSPP